MATDLTTQGTQPAANGSLIPQEKPNIEHLVTEDDTPVDSIYSERQMKLLTDSLETAWGPPREERKYLAAANVGLFFSVHEPPLVPDVFVSQGVMPLQDQREKRSRSYFFWEMGKPPDVVIEIVSKTEGGERTTKRAGYARIGVPHYVIWDPLKRLSTEPLECLTLQGGEYVTGEPWFPTLGIGVALWHGVVGGMVDDWLRWCDERGTLFPTGRERAVKAESALAKAESVIAKERERAERLAALLRELGVEPEPQ